VFFKENYADFQQKCNFWWGRGGRRRRRRRG
jgi:hypothetical protein